MTRRAWLAGAAGMAGCRRGEGIRLLTFPESYGHHLSIGRGSYERERIAVKAEYFQAFPKMMESLLAGEGDVATANYDAILPLAAAGRPVVAFCCLARRPGSLLAVSPKASRRIESIADLKGAVVGVPGPGSSSHHILNAILKTAGLGPADVSAVGIGVAASAVAAMESGKVDAAMLTNLGLATLRSRTPGVVVLADVRSEAGARQYLGAAQYPAMCLVATRGWLVGNAAAARAITRCFLDANRWMARQEPAQIRESLPSAARAAEAKADIEAIAGMLPTLETDGRISSEGAAAVHRVVADSVESVRLAKLDLAATFTSEFLQ